MKRSLGARRGTSGARWAASRCSSRSRPSASVAAHRTSRATRSASPREANAIRTPTRGGSHVPADPVHQHRQQHRQADPERIHTGRPLTSSDRLATLYPWLGDGLPAHVRDEACLARSIRRAAGCRSNRVRELEGPTHRLARTQRKPTNESRFVSWNAKRTEARIQKGLRVLQEPPRVTRSSPVPCAR
jgi:hypothetical protein